MCVYVYVNVSENVIVYIRVWGGVYECVRVCDVDVCECV